MKDLSTLAKLLAEEDIHVIHRKQSTAMFDVKNRELSLPIWKEMSKDIQDLMTVHEIGHALWTPLEQLERARNENIEFSFVNVLEDVRIEKLAQNKYPGSVKVFRRGYRELIQTNFFETLNRDISKINLIDRINLHYKHHVGVPFSSEEQVWVEKANNTVTPDDVLELAKELYEYMVQNQKEDDSEEQNIPKNSQSENMLSPDPSAMGMPSNTPTPSDEGDELEENSDNGNTADSKSENEGSIPSSPASSEESDEESDDVGSASSTEKSEEESDDSLSEEITGESQSDGGNGSKAPISASTDKASSTNTQNMLDGDASDRQYAFTPKVNTKEVIVSYKSILDRWGTWYAKQKSTDERWFNYTASELASTKKSSKKIVQYLVKEFEMKKAADLYSRSSTSKTGSLNMSKLHTYKYNDDLFAKITTLPGATNHGLVLFLDWSGSMAHNLQGTLNQLYNIIWFCNQVKIPFEVFAFSNVYTSTSNGRERGIDNFEKLTTAKSGEYKLRVNLLQFFSSKMKKNDIQTMMHYLNMYASRWGGFKDWKETGYPYSEHRAFGLGSTPLNDTIVCAMDILPMYKKSTGVQKLHTVFLTDGAGDSMDTVHHVKETSDGDVMSEKYMSSWFNGTTVITDSVTNKSVSGNTQSKGGQTTALLELLRKRVPDMSIVNFFVAGSGRSGNIKKNDLYSYFEYSEIPDKIKQLKKDNVLVVENGQGFDQLYLLPGLGGVSTDIDELDVKVGASKSQLKRAFGKMTSGKLTSRPVLNNFIKMVA